MNRDHAPGAGESWRVAALTMMTPQDLEAALSGERAGVWVAAAAACGIVKAQLRLGRMKLEGEGVAQDQAGAFACFAAAAAQGHAEAVNMLGRCHENGWGTRKDIAAATAVYRIAAEAGLAWAQYNLGHMLLAGDPEAAFGWYGKAAAQGHPRAMSLVGRCLEEGWGVGRDTRRALLWYRRSARGGYFRGAFNYASLLADKGFVSSAARWFQRALDSAPEQVRANMQIAIRKKDQTLYQPPALHAPGACA